MRQMTIWEIKTAGESSQRPRPIQVPRGIVFCDEHEEEAVSTCQELLNIWRGELLSFRPDSEWVYLMEASDSGRVKIGISANPDRRRKQLETSSPHRIILVCAIYGTVNLERRLHMTFKHAHITGEWFRDVPEIRRRFSELMKGE